MDMLRNMKIFAEVVEAGGFTAAGRKLNQSTPVVSRAIDDLEAHLRTRLLNRTTRRMALTEAGERYFARCVRIIGMVSEAEDEACHAQLKPSGTLRVHSMSSIGQKYVVPATAAYLKCYPGVRVDLTLTQDSPDLVGEHYDVALRACPGVLSDSNYVSRSIGELYSVLCASPVYLEEHGVPTCVEDLGGHHCLQVDLPVFRSDSWRLIGSSGTYDFSLPDGSFRVNVPEALASALLEGVGIGALPILTARPLRDEGKLVQVLPEYRLHALNIHVLYASRRFLDAKIKTWVEFVCNWISGALTSDDEAFREQTPLPADVPR
jgi:DNA-binding transcriptional LysR family regulator